MRPNKMTEQPTTNCEQRTSQADARGAVLWLRARDGAAAGSPTHAGELKRKRTHQAFTLIEVLLAVGIFAIVLFAMNTVFYSAMKLERATSRSVDERAALNQAFAQLRRDLRGAVPPLTNSYLLPRDFLVTGSSGRLAAEQSGSLEFYTTTGRLNDVDPWSELQRVRYELVASSDPASRGRELVRVVMRNILTTTTEEEVEQLLLGDVESLEFQCFDGASWISAWDTTAGDVGLPQAVRVRVLLAAHDPNATKLVRQPLELMVPIVAQSLTNQPTGGEQ
jgi:type II secretion system protein J